MAEVVQVAGRGCDAKAHRTLRELAVGPAFKSLRFGDFDGDGKTDVFTAVSVGGGAYQWKYSSGGKADFVNLAVGPALPALAFGDFDGDGRTDVFVSVCP